MTRTFDIDGKKIETNEQGFLCNLDDWSEDFAKALAEEDGLELFVDHWELIWYFRDYYAENLENPTMHTIVMSLGKKKGEHFHDHKAYEKHIYKLFPTDPVHEVCKLAGLPMPQPDT
ncbi:TusE/DsrC/DsvC family sulfur relay protein [Thiogranum longum]